MPSAAPRRRAVVLLSGGLDSATTAAIARADGFEVHALTVRYGQRHAIEVERAARLAETLGVTAHRVVDLDLRFAVSALTDVATTVPAHRGADEIGTDVPATYVPARNTVLLALALAWAETLSAHDLFIGANRVDYSGYPDCRPAFVSAFERLANVATRDGVEGRPFRVHAPLIDASKADIVRRAVTLGVDLAATISCYDPAPDGRPCAVCDACVLRARGFAEAGVQDPATR